MVKILWPDGPRYVSPEKVITWASDSYHNNADWYQCQACDRDAAHCSCADVLEPAPSEAAPRYHNDAVKPTTLEDAIAWLDETGEVTFARKAPR